MAVTGFPASTHENNLKMFASATKRGEKISAKIVRSSEILVHVQVTLNLQSVGDR